MRAGRDRLRDHARAAAGDAPLYLVKNRRFGAGPFDNAGLPLPAGFAPSAAKSSKLAAADSSKPFPFGGGPFDTLGLPLPAGFAPYG